MSYDLSKTPGPDLRRRALLGVALGSALAGPARARPGPDQLGASLSPWRPGLLDIHHISTGRGNAAFVVMPDGSTLLIDAGELDEAVFARHAPLRLGPERPRAGAGAGATIADYVTRHAPADRHPTIDYAVVTHFHDDHIGAAKPGSPLSGTGRYRLSGLTAVAAKVPIRRLLDRGDEDGVAEAGEATDSAYANYRAFAQDAVQRSGLRVERLRAGGVDQIVPLAPFVGPPFSVRVVKAGRRIWTGVGEADRELISKAQARQAGRGAENALSAALLIRYGAFSYFTGGDNTGLGAPERAPWQDVETPLAEVVGHVEAMTLDHHGNRDANGAALLKALSPHLIVQQCWTSDQPGQEVAHRLLSRALWPQERLAFATQTSPEAAAAIGPPMGKLFHPVTGHVVLRVSPSGSYEVFVLSDRQPGAQILFTRRVDLAAAAPLSPQAPQDLGTR